MVPAQKFGGHKDSHNFQQEPVISSNLCGLLQPSTILVTLQAGQSSLDHAACNNFWLLQVKPFRKLRKVHNQGKRTRLRDLIRYDLRQMHAAFTGTLPVGSKSEPLGQQQVGTSYVSLASLSFCVYVCCECGSPALISVLYSPYLAASNG